MGSRVLFVAGPEDMRELTAFIRSLGIHVVPPQLGMAYSDDPTILGRCFLSPVDQYALQTWGTPPVRFSDALDPILSLTRSVYKPPYLRPGEIYWNNDVPSLAAQTKSTFQKLNRWVRKNWPKPQDYDYYYGPEARRLVFEEGVIATSLVPGVKLVRIERGKPHRLR